MENGKNVYDGIRKILIDRKNDTTIEIESINREIEAVSGKLHELRLALEKMTERADVIEDMIQETEMIIAHMIVP